MRPEARASRGGAPTAALGCGADPAHAEAPYAGAGRPAVHHRAVSLGRVASQAEGQAGQSPYSVENALFQWEEGERRLLEAPDVERSQLELATDVVLGELRRRLGSSFTVEELAAMYGAGVDWASDLAGGQGAGGDAAWVVDAAFGRYAREAVNFGGGRRHRQSERL